MNFTNLHNKLLRNPDPDGSGGGAAPANPPVGGDAAPAAPAFDPQAFETQFSSRLQEETGRIRSEYERKFSDLESRLPRAPEPAADKKPVMKDFLKNGEMTEDSWEAYQEARIAYSLKEHRATWEKEQQERGQREASESRVESTLAAHSQRASKYKTENPDYNPNGSLAFRNEAITLAIADSDFSAHIHHFFQKNPDKLAELRGIEREKGAIAALRFVGRMESQFESQAQAPGRTDKIVKATPTRVAFGGANGSATVKRTPEEIAADWN